MLFNKKDWMFRWHALIGSGSKNLHPTRENRGYGSFDGNINLFRWLLEHRIAPQVTGKRPLERRIRRNEGKKRYAAFSFFPPSFVEVFPNFSKFPRVFLALSRAVGRETKRNSSRPSLSLSLSGRFREFRAERTAWFIMRRVNWKHLQFRRFPHCGFAIDPSASINMPRYTISGLRQVYYPGHDGKIATRVIPVLLINFPRSRSHLTPVGNCRPNCRASIPPTGELLSTFFLLFSSLYHYSYTRGLRVYLPYILLRVVDVVVTRCDRLIENSLLARSRY